MSRGQYIALCLSIASIYSSSLNNQEQNVAKISDNACTIFSPACIYLVSFLGEEVRGQGQRAAQCSRSKCGGLHAVRFIASNVSHCKQWSVRSFRSHTVHPVELTAADWTWLIADTDSVLRALEDRAVLQSLRNTATAAYWQLNKDYFANTNFLACLLT